MLIPLCRDHHNLASCSLCEPDIRRSCFSCLDHLRSRRWSLTLSAAKLSNAERPCPFSFPVDGSFEVDDTAIGTISDFRLISAGSNLGMLPGVLTGKPNLLEELYAPQYNPTLHNTQDNYAWIDLGPITNTGWNVKENHVSLKTNKVQAPPA